MQQKSTTGMSDNQRWITARGDSMGLRIGLGLFISQMFAQGCGLGLDVSVSRRSRDVPTSRLEKNCQRLGLVSVSSFYVSCPSLVLLWCQCINSFLMGMQITPYAV